MALLCFVQQRYQTRSQFPNLSVANSAKAAAARHNLEQSLTEVMTSHEDQDCESVQRELSAEK
jgi:hypothetical protein